MSIIIEGTPIDINQGETYIAESGAGVGSNRIVAFLVTDAGPGVVPSSMTMGTQGASLVNLRTAAVAGDDVACSVFYIKEADIPTGAQTITVSGIVNDPKIFCFTLSNVNQTSVVKSTVGSFELTATTSVSFSGLTSVENGLALSVVARKGGGFVGLTEPTGWTEEFDLRHRTGLARVAAASIVTDGSTYSGTWVGTPAGEWATVAVSFDSASKGISCTSSPLTFIGGDAELSATNVVSESPTTWFNGEWWRSPWWGSSWWPAAGNVTLNCESSELSFTGGDADLVPPAITITLDCDAGALTFTGGNGALSTPVQGDAGTLTFTGGDATFSIEFTSELFTISKVGTFDNLGIIYNKDVAFNPNTDIGYKILSRIDVDTIEIDKVFGTPPQQYSIQRQIAETSLPAKMTFEFNGTDWVLIDIHNIGL